MLLDLKHALVAAKNMANIVRTFGDDDMKEKICQIGDYEIAGIVV